MIDDSLTEVYPWGWILYFVPTLEERCRNNYFQEECACENEMGISLPIGTLGLEFTLEWIAGAKAHRKVL